EWGPREAEGGKEGKGPLALRALLCLSGLRRELLEELGRALVDFRPREIFLPRGDIPLIPERVDQAAAAIAPELIGHLAHRSGRPVRARIDGAREQRIAVGAINPERDRRAAEHLRALALPHHVIEHEPRAADLQLGVHDLAVRSKRARFLLGAE